jgi:transposase InsO family protein
VRGWALLGNLGTELILEAWHRACTKHPAPTFHHSDRGSQYCAAEYIPAIQKDGTRVSMSAKGECTQNPYIESFWRTVKVEEVYLKEYETMEDALQNIENFIEIVYAKKRLHASLDYRTPEEFEEGWRKQQKLVS